ncbi:MAG: nucleoside-diphosphate kinase [Candidatus Latescibacteria bacterium]|nr:nucleoside-diphosphate kinase [Candidatus Latescibacterota bacterium]NIM20984.1 nucleoside-diphosphate kinase [Candidatus Latescibacterota bacterium]NIM65119.1 nucleoside-diphosphate kinase [Candidatus Latescibacterota bacterium]NIO01634.1 nucleoside-diphosphate kinase [Candidatus Latescibacterota bacterium]NIO28151.1 nucleoside-diphosphate kinase [Candidatus Latescibacterota bacterium]
MNTLLMIKPEVVEKGLFGEIISIILRNRFTVAKMIMFTFDKKQAERFYDIHKEREFFPSLIEYITSGPVVALELQGEDAIRRLRDLVGSTDPCKAAPGTIRYVYGSSIQANAVHASDSPEAAKKELAIVFSGF